MTQHFKVLILGGGSAGISVAARLRKTLAAGEIAIVDPAQTHYYQPLWTLVGGGDAKKESTARPQSSVIPEGVTWIKEAVAAVHPDETTVLTASEGTLTYDYLVVCPGLELHWAGVEGLEGNVGKDGICSNYSYETVDSTWAEIQKFDGGTAVFTHPATPIKCGGAPQKIMYLAADYWRKKGILHRCDIVFMIATPKIFTVDHYGKELVKVAQRYGIDVRYQQNLVAVDAARHEATFAHTATGDKTELEYKMMHVTPPMRAPAFVREGALGDKAGWVEVDKHSLRHTRYPNIFSLGDASNLPTSKTGAAIRKQAPVCAQNLLAVINGKEPTARYDGYTSCPLVTGYGKLILAEFDYDLKPKETFPIDQSKERWSMYQLKKRMLPKLYWNGMLKGRA